MVKEHISNILFLEGKKIWFKESPPSITVTKNPYYSIEILWYITDYAKENILSPFKRPTWDSCIAGLVLNCHKFVLFCFWWPAYNIPDSSVSEYSATNTSNYDVGKYYVTKKVWYSLLWC